METQEKRIMPAKSKSQQRFMGMVHAVQQGKLDPSKVSKDVRGAASSMKSSEVKDFASTKHEGLVEKSASLKDYISKYAVRPMTLADVIPGLSKGERAAMASNSKINSASIEAGKRFKKGLVRGGLAGAALGIGGYAAYQGLTKGKKK